MEQHERNVGFPLVRRPVGRFVGGFDTLQYPAQALQYGLGWIVWRRRKFQGAELSSVQEEDVRERPSGLMGGGVMPDEDVLKLKRMGVQEILLQDTSPQSIVATVERLVAERGPR